MDLDILAWPNPVLACLWGKFRSARESWIHKDLDLSEASALWGAMTNAKASEKCKTRMTGRWFWCLGGGVWREGVGQHFATSRAGAVLLFGMPLIENLGSFNASETEKYPAAGSPSGFILLSWG